jgi:AsmA protein
MRHWAVAAGAAIGVAFGVSLGTVAWPIDPGRVQRDFAAAFGRLEAPSRATFTLLPRPTLRIEGVRGAAADGAFTVQAAGAEATLRLDRLLRGEFSPQTLTLQGAELSIDADVAKAAFPRLDPPALNRLILQGATVDLVSADPAATAHFEIASARFDWNSGKGTLRARATGRWRSQPVDASAELDAPLAAAHGEASPIRAAIDAPLAQLRLSGDWSPARTLDGALFRGQGSALIPSLSRFSRWVGMEPPAGHMPPGLELQARLDVDYDRLKLADVTLTLGGQAFEGALDILRAPPGLSVSGTLAADALDLEPLIGPPPTLIDAAGGWSRAPALPEPSPRLDLDLRVSATRAVWRGIVLTDAAAAVSQRNGRLGLRLLEADYARGSLSGEISVEEKDGVCESRMSLALENADLGALLAGFGERNFSGSGELKASIRAHGRSPAEIAASADGDGTLDIADGALRRLNFEEALRRGQRRLIDVAHDMNAGATRFGAAHGRVEISNGEARFVDAATQSPGVSLALTGGIDLINRAWRARLAVRQSSDDGKPTPDGAHVDFSLDGPWGGAALAPLLPPAN